MSYGPNLRTDGALDPVSLGTLVHRLDSGIIPFRTASRCDIYVSSGGFNVAANLADCGMPRQWELDRLHPNNPSRW
jgi:2-dehydro-3-deoxygluconokinase